MCASYRFGWAICLLAGLLLSSCSFSHQRALLVDEVARGEYGPALATLNKIESSRPNLLDLMDRGLILHLQGEYGQSNEVFSAAERMIDELYALSISREAGTWLINDLTQAYSGEDFERVYVNVFKAANYVNLGQYSEALVEIRKIDNRLKVYTGELGGRAVFKSHAFAQLLSGLFHESTNNLNDAYVSFRQARQSYGDYERDFGVALPNALKYYLMESSARLGLATDLQSYQRDYPQVKFAAADLKTKEIVFVVGLGKIAHKEERFWSLTGPGGGLLRVAYPEFVDTPFSVRAVEVRPSAPGAAPAPGELVEDLSAIAKKTLSQRMALIRGRATSRMLAKAAASAAAGVAVAKSTDNAGAGALTAIFTNLLLSETERADTRSWLTLPAQIHLVRVQVPADFKEMDFEVDYKSGRGAGANTSEHVKVQNQQSQKIFVFLRAKEI